MKSIELSLTRFSLTHRAMDEKIEKIVTSFAREGTLEAAALYANLATSLMCHVSIEKTLDRIS